MELADRFDTIGTKDVPPDPAILQAIGLNHSLESALADLVDNSIDAGAARILIRLVLKGGLIHRLVVVDNGVGMTSDVIDVAMTLGGQSERPERALGHFGVGLKAASFSQAGVLTVFSRTAPGLAVGRRMTRGVDDGFAVATVAAHAAEHALGLSWADFETPAGTIVIWDELRNVPHNPAATRTFTSDIVERLRHHLGLVFHRLVARRDVRIDIDVYTTEDAQPGLPFEVEAINPFGYPRSGSFEYPKELLARLGGQQVALHCHIWPGRSTSPLFNLAGKTADESQGFYLYRNDRLLLAGGWCGIESASRHRRLARIAVDIEGAESWFRMSAEKAQVGFVADLADAIVRAKASDGTVFADYLVASELVLKAANARKTKRRPMLPPGQGLGPRIRRAIEREVETIGGEEPIRIRWRNDSSTDFIHVDRHSQTIWLNSRYRTAVLKGTRGGVNDAPLLKALLYLLYEDIFQGTAFGPRDKDNVNLWREILNAAAIEELDAHDE